jgi:hypothetical protein
MIALRLSVKIYLDKTTSILTFKVYFYNLSFVAATVELKYMSSQQRDS